MIDSSWTISQPPVLSGEGGQGRISNSERDVGIKCSKMFFFFTKRNMQISRILSGLCTDLNLHPQYCWQLLNFLCTLCLRTMTMNFYIVFITKLLTSVTFPYSRSQFTLVYILILFFLSNLVIFKQSQSNTGLYVHRHANQLPWYSKLQCVSVVTTPVGNLQQIQADSS